MRSTFTAVGTHIIQNSENSALLLGDIGVYGFRELLSNYPNRAINIGILEQSMIGVAAGLASEGVIPLVHTIAPFLIERALEQIKVDFGYQQLPGNFVSVGASFDYSRLGCTHHCPADINILSNIPGMTLFIPGHKNEFGIQLSENWNSGGMNYFRLSESENESEISMVPGEVKKIKDGNQGIIIVVGPFLEQTMSGTKDLDIEIHYVNSLISGKSMNFSSDSNIRKLILIEPYYSGALNAKLFSQINKGGYEVLQIGVPMEFIRSYGSYEENLENLNLDARSLKRRIQEFLNI